VTGPAQKPPTVAFTSGIQTGGIVGLLLDGDVRVLVEQLIVGDEVLIVAYVVAVT